MLMKKYVPKLDVLNDNAIYFLCLLRAHFIRTGSVDA
jgi:hypothetical protein